MFKPFQLGDLWGGLSSAAVILPQAMAFGVALWGPYNLDAGTAALSGLIAVASLSIFSGLSGGTPGMVSSPTGPTLVLLSGALATFTQLGFSGADLQTLLVVMLLCAGLFQALIGISNGGHLIKFIPSPVVTGFMTGSAILMVMSQIGPVRGDGADVLWQNWFWLPALTAMVTFIAMTWVPKMLPVVPGTVAGLVIGTIVFHVLTLFGPGDVPTAWTIGTLPGADSIKLGVTVDVFAQIPWLAILPVSLALAVLASLDSLLTSVVADVETGERHSAKKELVGQGLGQMVSGLLGGMAGAGTTGATVVAIKSGGRFWVAVATGIVFILLVLFMGPAAKILPISVLAGIILHVAIMGMLERDMLMWLKRRRTRVEGVTALLVTGVTVGFDLMIAVGVGVALAILRFVQLQIQSPVIRRRSTVTQRPSLRRRNDQERAILAERGDRVILYELQGNLFFGTVDRLFNDMLPDLDRSAWVVIDMGRVTQVDITAVKMIYQMAARIQSHGGELLFANVRSGKGLGKKVEKTLKKVSPFSHIPKVKTFIDADEALEYAEQELLNWLGFPAEAVHKRVELSDIELFAELNPQQLQTINEAAEHLEAASGEYLFHAGDKGDTLYIVLKGEVDILLPYGKHHYKRIATFGPGTYFGEVVFLEPGERTAHAKVIHDAELMLLSHLHLQQIEKNNPEVVIGLLTMLGRKLGEYLRWTDGELRRLSD